MKDHTEEQKLDGTRLKNIHVLLEILNGCQEPGRISVEERFRICAPKLGRKLGRIQVTSTVEDMERGGKNPLWNENKD